MTAGPAVMFFTLFKYSVPGLGGGLLPSVWIEAFVVHLTVKVTDHRNPPHFDMSCSLVASVFSSAAVIPSHPVTCVSFRLLPGPFHRCGGALAHSTESA